MAIRSVGGLPLNAGPALWAAVVLGAWAGGELLRAGRELRWLSGVLRAVVGRPRIASREDLLALRRYLTAHVTFTGPPPAGLRRPLLRASARETLESGLGWCGENARVAVLLLNLGGVSAHRFYLRGARWNHVAVEHWWEGAWRFFDAHNDPGTLPPDDEVGRLTCGLLERLPNAYRERNPWIDGFRVPLHVPLLRVLRQAKLPGPVAVALESPALVRGAFALTLAAAALLWAV